MKYLLTALSTSVFGFLLNAQITIQATVPGTLAANTEIKFDVRINKGSVSNFSKYQMDVPAGITINEVDCKTGNFSFENNRAKVIWVTTPAEPEFAITLKMNSGSGGNPGTIHQKFYYLENGSKREVEADPINIVFGASASPVPVAAMNSTPANEFSEIKTSNTLKSGSATTPAVQEHAATETLVKKNTAAEINKPADTQATVKETSTSPASGVVYKVQLAASAEKPVMSKYASIKEVNIAREGTMYKVLVGNFSNKEDAVKLKTDLAARGFNGFVVAYQNGERLK